MFAPPARDLGQPGQRLLDDDLRFAADDLTGIAVQRDDVTLVENPVADRTAAMVEIDRQRVATHQAHLVHLPGDNSGMGGPSAHGGQQPRRGGNACDVSGRRGLPDQNHRLALVGNRLRRARVERDASARDATAGRRGSAERALVVDGFDAQALDAVEIDRAEPFERLAGVKDSFRHQLGDQGVGLRFPFLGPALGGGAVLVRAQPLTREHIKPRLLGHWGTTPGLNFIYVHLNRVIVNHDLDMNLSVTADLAAASDRDLGPRPESTAWAPWKTCFGIAAWTGPSYARHGKQQTTGIYRTAYGHNLRRGLLISRADVAHLMLLMLHVLERPETIRKAIGVAY